MIRVLILALGLVALGCADRQIIDDDSADDDAADDDAGDDDTGGDDDSGDDDTSVGNTLSVAITSPGALATFEVGTFVDFVGTVTDSEHAPDTLSYRWISDVDGEIGQGTLDPKGVASLNITNLSAGPHNITLEGTNPEQEIATDDVPIGICTWQSPESFDTDIEGAGWQTYMDATWDPAGFLEMTGDAQNRHGAVFNLVDEVLPGDVSISFWIRTGPHVGDGADGFAMSVFDAGSVTALEDIIYAAADGGGLGYAVGGAYGNTVVDAFHVEIDTWHNIDNGNTELHTDPAPKGENHIAVTLDGDPGDHVAWAAVPSIEDSQWHEVTIDVVESHVTITLDQQVVIDENIQGLFFSGGFIGFTGTTGYYTNLHSFDDLEILQECIVPS